MTPALESALARYINSGWLDANRDHFDDDALRGALMPAYVVLSSISMKVAPRSEVQVTARCHRLFRAHKMIITDETRRFDLLDLKVGNRSQFKRAEDVKLRGYRANTELRPESIRWPLELCPYGADVSIRAIIPEGSDDDPEAGFELVLLGEVQL